MANGRRPMILSPHGGQANADSDDTPMTRAQVKELIVDVVGPLAHSFLALEKSHQELQGAYAELEGKHNALVSALGLTYNVPWKLALVPDTPEHSDGSQPAVDRDLQTDGEKALPESGSRGASPQASQTGPE